MDDEPNFCSCNNPDYRHSHKMVTDGGLKMSEPDMDEAEEYFSKFIESLGLDVDNDEHLQDTPRRVAKSRINELFRGLNENPDKHLERTFSDGVSDDFVIVGDIQVKSMCAHHFLPFTGKAWIGYIPNDEVVGLSKLARVLDGYARRPQVQERLTNQVANAIYENLEPKAVVVHIDAVHECMSLRGVEEPHSSTLTTALRGDAKDDHTIKSEFFDMIDK